MIYSSRIRIRVCVSTRYSSSWSALRTRERSLSVKNSMRHSSNANWRIVSVQICFIQNQTNDTQDYTCLLRQICRNFLGLRCCEGQGFQTLLFRIWYSYQRVFGLEQGIIYRETDQGIINFRRRISMFNASKMISKMTALLKLSSVSWATIVIGFQENSKYGKMVGFFQYLVQNKITKCI